MGLRVRRSVNIAPGVKFNVSKKSVGFTVGTKGAHYSVNSSGRKTSSVGIPGTGVSYVSSTTSKKGTSGYNSSSTNNTIKTNKKTKQTVTIPDEENKQYYDAIKKMANNKGKYGKIALKALKYYDKGYKFTGDIVISDKGTDLSYSLLKNGRVIYFSIAVALFLWGISIMPIGIIVILFSLLFLAAAFSFSRQMQICKLLKDNIVITTTESVQTKQKKEHTDMSDGEIQRMEFLVHVNEEKTRFNYILSNLEEFPIELSGEKLKRRTVSDLEEIKFSTITSRTSKDNLRDFVVIDTETTGLKATDDLIEVSAVRFIDFKPAQIFETYLKPRNPIPKEITAINGITDEMVKDAPEAYQVIDSFEKFIGKSPIVGHNLSFDLKMLRVNNFAFDTCKRRYFDTLSLAKKILKKQRRKYDFESQSYEPDWDDYDYDVEDYKLVTICDFYKIYFDAHRSSADSMACGMIFSKFIELLIP